MAVTLTRSSKARSTGTSPTLSFAATPAVDSQIVVGIALDLGGGASGPVSVSDNQGNTYTQRVTGDYNTGQARNRIYTAKATTSSGTFTITLNTAGTGSKDFWIAEFAGCDVSGGDAFDAAGTLASGTSTSPSASVTATTTAAIVGIVSHYSGTTSITEANTIIQEEEDASSGMPMNGQFQPTQAAGSRSSSWTLGASSSWGACAIALKEAAGGGGTIRRYSLTLTGVG